MFTHVRECETCVIMALLRYLHPVDDVLDPNGHLSAIIVPSQMIAQVNCEVRGEYNNCPRLEEVVREGTKG